jgi:hypothetical protein
VPAAGEVTPSCQDDQGKSDELDTAPGARGEPDPRPAGIGAGDFDCRLADPAELDRLFGALARAINEWIVAQRTWTASALDWRAEVERFYELYLGSPYRAMSGGSRFNNQLWLYAVTKAYAPKLVVDSGTYQGASAWALDLAAPGKVISFDIDLSQLVRREPGVRYVERDWYGADILSGEALGGALIYFDDHLNQARRLLEAQAAGIPFAVFDDDFRSPRSPTWRMMDLHCPKSSFSWMTRL